ncbi:MAG: hypothetical protein JJU12_07990 [Chlamydiales bacterium]|nr:hypothetical protein [Chlamydiales bacterium]
MKKRLAHGALVLLFLYIPLCASEIKEEIATLQNALARRSNDETHFKLAHAYFRDQEVDKAFRHFLSALKLISPEPAPEMSPEEKFLYEAALTDYLKGGGSDPTKIAGEMIEDYGEAADSHPEWIHLNFLIAAAYGNLGRYDTFFDRFFHGYRFLGDSFLAYKILGILCLRLSRHGHCLGEGDAEREEAFDYLTRALERNPIDPSLYNVLIFLAKNEKNDALVLNYLQKMVEMQAHIPRGEIYLYVQEAVALGEFDLGQEIIDLAGMQYEFSRAISIAQEYLNVKRLECKNRS